jgi:hypothetical protein
MYLKNSKKIKIFKMKRAKAGEIKIKNLLENYEPQNEKSKSEIRRNTTDKIYPVRTVGYAIKTSLNHRRPVRPRAEAHHSNPVRCISICRAIRPVTSFHKPSNSSASCLALTGPPVRRIYMEKEWF